MYFANKHGKRKLYVNFTKQNRLVSISREFQHNIITDALVFCQAVSKQLPCCVSCYLWCSSMLCLEDEMKHLTVAPKPLDSSSQSPASAPASPHLDG